MDTKLLDAIRTIIREEIQIALRPINVRLDRIEARMDRIELEMIKLRRDVEEGFKRIDIRLKAMDYKLVEQDNKLDTIQEGWGIQKEHRRELDDHEDRIQAIEHRIPVAS